MLARRILSRVQSAASFLLGTLNRLSAKKYILSSIGHPEFNHLPYAIARLAVLFSSECQT
jgi:hypothetical protein